MGIPTCICAVWGALEAVTAVLLVSFFVWGFLWMIWPVIGPLYWFVREDLLPELWAIAYTSRLGIRVRRFRQLSILSYQLLSLLLWTWWHEWSWQFWWERNTTRWRVK